jgi:hypothetical protein
LRRIAATSALNEAGAASAMSRTRRATRTRAPRTGTTAPRQNLGRSPARGLDAKFDGISPATIHGRQADDAAAEPRAHGSADSEMKPSAPGGMVPG